MWCLAAPWPFINVVRKRESPALPEKVLGSEKSQMDPNDQNPAQTPAAPAEPAAPAQPAAEPAQPAAPAEGQPAAEPTGQPSAPETPGEGGGAPAAPQQTRQERRDQERASRGISSIGQQFQQGQQFNQQQPGGQQSPQMPQYKDGETVSPERLQQDVVQTASAIANLQIERQLQHRDAVHTFERDADHLPTKFKELNPDPDNAAYVPELDEAIAQEYQERAFRTVGYDNQGRPIRQLDTSVRLSDIAERQVRAARAYAAKSNASINTAVAQTADEGAPRPTGQTPSEIPFEKLSLKEMKARVGYHKQ